VKYRNVLILQRIYGCVWYCVLQDTSKLEQGIISTSKW